MDITNKTDIEIKAIAYDEIAKIELAQKNLDVCTAMLRQRVQITKATPPSQEVIDVEPKEE